MTSAEDHDPTEASAEAAHERGALARKGHAPFLALAALRVLADDALGVTLDAHTAAQIVSWGLADRDDDPRVDVTVDTEDVEDEGETDDDARARRALGDLDPSPAAKHPASGAEPALIEAHAARVWAASDVGLREARRLSLLRALLTRHPPTRRGPHWERLRRFCREAALEPLASDLLSLAPEPLFVTFAAQVATRHACPPHEALCRVLAAALVTGLDTMREALSAEGVLAQAGLLSLTAPGDVTPRFGLGPNVCAWLARKSRACEARLAPRTLPPTPWVEADFAHATDTWGVLDTVLGAALDAARGLRIALRGPDESGRRTMLRALADRLRAEVIALPAGTPEALVLPLSVARRSAGRRALLVIEGDPPDSLSSGPRHLRRAREEAEGRAEDRLAAPALPLVYLLSPGFGHEPWDTPEDGPAFDLDLSLPSLPTRARTRALAHAIGNDLEAPPAWVRALAEGAMGLGAATRIARLVATVDPERADVLGRSLGRASAHESRGRRARDESTPLPAPPRAILPYALEWVSTDLPPEALVSAVRRAPGGKLLFHGPPGTGKSALARHLASSAGLELVERSASQLLSMWVGGTEKALAAAFAEARAKGAFLLIDEADSFLCSRERALRSWEVSQVNEFLTQLERHAGWIACTTNLLDTLDPASLRRFPLKVAFAPPGPAVRRAIFDAAALALGVHIRPDDEAAVTRALAAGEGLTPGDAAAATEQIAALGAPIDAATLASRLVLEVSYRSRRARSVGF